MGGLPRRSWRNYELGQILAQAFPQATSALTTAAGSMVFPPWFLRPNNMPLCAKSLEMAATAGVEKGVLDWLVTSWIGSSDFGPGRGLSLCLLRRVPGVVVVCVWAGLVPLLALASTPGR